MPLTATKLPFKETSESTCYWSAGHNPIVFEFQGSNYYPTSYNPFNGKMQVYGTHTTTPVEIGDTVKFKVGDESGFAEVTDKQPGYIIIDHNVTTSASANDGDSINIVYQTHFVVFKVYNEHGSLLGSVRSVFNPDYKVKFNASAFIKELFERNGINDYTPGGVFDYSGMYRVTHQEFIDGNYLTEHNIVNNSGLFFYALDAAMQFGAKYGGNMLEYTPPISDLTNYLSNGLFDGLDNWTVNSNGVQNSMNTAFVGLSITIHNWNGTYLGLTPSVLFEDGVEYELSFEINQITDAIVKVYVDALGTPQNILTVTTTGIHTINIVGGGDLNLHFRFMEDQNYLTGSVSINNVTLIKVPSTYRAKFLTAFKKTKIWKGFPISLTTIIPETGTGVHELKTNLDNIQPLTDNSGNFITDNSGNIITI